MSHQSHITNPNSNSDSTLKETLTENLKGYQVLVDNLTNHLGNLIKHDEKRSSDLFEIIGLLSQQVTELQKYADALQKHADALLKQAEALQKQADAMQKQVEILQKQADDSRELTKEILLMSKEFRSGSVVSSGDNPSALQQITDYHIDDKLDLIYKSSVQKFSKLLRSDLGIGPLLKYFYDFRAFLEFHKKGHLADYLDGMDVKNITLSEKDTLGQMIRSAVDNKIEEDLRINPLTTSDQKEDDYAIKLFNYVMKKVIGKKLELQDYLSYANTIHLQVKQNGLNLYKFRIGQLKHLQTWFNLGNNEPHAINNLYNNLPENAKRYIRKSWCDDNNIASTSKVEDLDDDIKDGLTTFDQYLGYATVAYHNMPMENDSSSIMKTRVSHPPNKDENKRNISNKPKSSNKKEKAFVNKATTITNTTSGDSARPSYH
ncbi:hypothetical protein HYPBUDRAFT_206577 [Hyphopichia burtonii NRRL Y-1933]|uniref:Uncharacterized protein n=1 Tax=Hyphopichia burtonii NRRL Y-1933 TaxID=984485 RepID=A0A1E4RI80_9ASCO|nr:hypothetical protein HYPBUDRAFT_206577 [Hyphopichia burtonii NRRL Y-1933]ODV66982.1 hypothetical protein HYPBUDRAFT_206577 [Hyphopichia burtonii NRRL Y-1933]